ncbi:MAG: NAD-dependent epimerase/dehydratase family protein [Candidatus Aenigmarchaeota archaeon]|nr:NAD-dependent epimerase/dehydratase family protein [Candidatus Aenigmarchaeota archaeon]
MRTIAITGGSGFIGSWLAKSLHADRVVDISRRSGQDLAHLGNLGVRVDYCVHLAGVSDVKECERDPQRAFEVNVEGTLRVLRWCQRSGVKGVIFASSGKAYGSGDGPVDERQPLEPYNMYGRSKAWADYLAQGFSWTHRLPVITARLVNVYGPGDQNTARIIPYTIDAVRRGERPVIYGDGSARRAFIYVSDVVAFFLAALDRLEEGHEGGVFNVSTDETYPIRDVVTRIIRRMGSGLEPRFLPGDASRSDYLLRNAKARSLGWEPRVGMDQGLQETIA